ncbi:uncharacterized protein EAE97_012007 [Botrytis byssoidea]|uniref:Uncharacterized protein n=1 Tax=Botrytis byssoidea TaxID=139641 RepID=A0A9P5HRM4_9HELO|nr:uncharacterized protein EAE97_012007 [Botrytis byssoidea]KAF7917869.1 hypothetical protein EAE97_012007 [Botrytis byssoidea]
MPNQDSQSNNNAADGEQLPPIRLAGESMEQSFDRVAREAQRSRVAPDSLLAHSIPRVWGNSAERVHMHGNPQANNNASCYVVTANPQYRSGTSTSHGSGVVTSNGNASRQSNPGAQRDDCGWGTASPHAQNTRTSAWNGRDQSGGANFHSERRGDYQ